VKIVSKKEGLEDIYPLKHSERIHKLYRQNAIEEDIYMKMEWIRIYELLDKLYVVREELLEKVNGQTKSWLTPEQEPYYNKLVEVFEEQREGSELKSIAVDVQHFIEGRVTPIRDWKSKTDFKRKLNADLKIILLKKKMSMSDASMLVGYFTALAEVQYG
jgi:type I restriction enzyme R subunit